MSSKEYIALDEHLYHFQHDAELVALAQILSERAKLKIGHVRNLKVVSWNMKTVYQAGKLHYLILEMKRLVLWELVSFDDWETFTGQRHALCLMR